VSNFLGSVELGLGLLHGFVSDLGSTLSADCLSLEVSDLVAGVSVVVDGAVSVADDLESLVGVSGPHSLLNYTVGLFLGLSDDGVLLGSGEPHSSALLGVGLSKVHVHFHVFVRLSELSLSLGHLSSSHLLLSQASLGNLSSAVDGHVVDDMNSSLNVFVAGGMALAVNAAL